MTNDSDELLSELRHIDVAELAFPLRKLWTCVIRTMEKVDSLEHELEETKKKLNDIKFKYEMKEDE